MAEDATSRGLGPILDISPANGQTGQDDTKFPAAGDARFASGANLPASS